MSWKCLVVLKEKKCNIRGDIMEVGRNQYKRGPSFKFWIIEKKICNNIRAHYELSPDFKCKKCNMDV